MKHPNVRLLATAVAASLSLAASSAGLYSVIDIGTFSNRSNARGINASGLVAGDCLDSTLTVSLSGLYANGTLTNIGAPAGRSNSVSWAINTTGQVAGYAYNSTGDTRATLYSQGAFTTLGTLGGSTSNAYGINDLGQVVGNADLADGSSHAFRYTGGTMEDLGTLGGSLSYAHAINGSAQVAGTSAVTPGGVSHAFLYSGRTMTDLGSLLGSGFSSAGWAMNALGQVVGSTDTATGSHAFLYANGTMKDLGSLAANKASYAYAINASGLVAGSAYKSSGPQVAFVYVDGAMSDLNTLTDATGVGWSLQAVSGMNDAGQMVGYGSHNGQARGFILTPRPVPEPTTLAALGLGAVGLLRRRRSAAERAGHNEGCATSGS